MFTKKVRRSWINTTDSFLAEMLRAILKEMIGADAYLTQTKFVAQKARKPESCEMIPEWKNVNRVLEVEVETYFTAVDFPQEHGGVNVITLLPKATAKFRLTSEAEDWYDWQLRSVEVEIEHFLEYLSETKVALAFVGGGDWFAKAPDHLRHLAHELQHRGHSRLREDE